MSERRIVLLGARAAHSGRPGEPSYIELNLVLEYLKGEPIANIVLTPHEALRLAEQLLTAERVTRPQP